MKAEEVKKSEARKGQKANKRGSKKAAKTWSAAEWAQYQDDELDKAERGSVMSSNLADDTTIASTVDVADMEDFQEYHPAIDEETEAPWRDWKEPAGYGGGLALIHI